MKTKDLLEFITSPNFSVEKDYDGSYSATDLNTYDGAPDSDTNIIGRGKTKMAAIRHLCRQLSDLEMYSDDALHV